MMWMLSFIPDSVLLYVVNTILLIGVVSSFITFFAINRLLRWFPAIAPYYLVLQIVSAVLLVSGIYLKGGYGVEMEWRGRVAELEAKIAKAEIESKETNQKLSEEVKKKNKVITETKVVIQERIKVEKEKIDAECKVAPEAVNILNQAAKLPEGLRKK